LNSSTWEAKARLQVQGQPELQGKTLSQNKQTSNNSSIMSSSATGQNGEMIRFTLWLKQTKLQTKYETNRTHWVAGSDL
jgi:hypothetical protein